MPAMSADRSFVIPVLDFSPHSPFNVFSLLTDLHEAPGEVICVFNSADVYRALRDHPRIDKYCFNSRNAGVSRSWNIGINLAEGRSVFVLNADLHILPRAIEQMERYLHELPDAALVGPQGSLVDFRTLEVRAYYQKGRFHEPVRTDDVSGFCFAIHRERFLGRGLAFDVRYSPCFMEEWDMGMQVRQAGLACYAVPVVDFEHHWGISVARGDVAIPYFGREVSRDALLEENRGKFLAKWFGKA
jgi:GT2 family glycosyltransferase